MRYPAQPVVQQRMLGEDRSSAGARAGPTPIEQYGLDAIARILVEPRVVGVARRADLDVTVIHSVDEHNRHLAPRVSRDSIDVIKLGESRLGTRARKQIRRL